MAGTADGAHPWRATPAERTSFADYGPGRQFPAVRTPTGGSHRRASPRIVRRIRTSVAANAWALGPIRPCPRRLAPERLRGSDGMPGLK